MPLVISGLGGGHTDTDTDTNTHTHTDTWTKAISRRPRVPGLIIPSNMQ